jgi:hypothetical protein
MIIYSEAWSVVGSVAWLVSGVPAAPVTATTSVEAKQTRFGKPKMNDVRLAMLRLKPWMNWSGKI